MKYLWEWIRYTPFFFCNAPFKKWHTYFASCHRVSSSMVYAKEELAKAEGYWPKMARIEQLRNAGKGKENQ